MNSLFHFPDSPPPQPSLSYAQRCILTGVVFFVGICVFVIYIKFCDRTAAANNGLKKKDLKYLEKLKYTVDNNDNLSDCTICLAEFVAGDELRVLPQCGHGFHVKCIDPWLGFHSFCPTCRQNVVITKCVECSSNVNDCGLPTSSSSSSVIAAIHGGAECEARLKGEIKLTINAVNYH